MLGVTGATGNIGGAVARVLAAGGQEQRLVVRDPSRAPRLPRAEVTQAAYDDADALRRALDGVDVLLLVSAAEHPDRLAQHRNVVAAAAATGVQRVVYTSFFGAAPEATFTLARDHYWTEVSLAEAGVPTTALRSNLYADLLPLLFDEQGVIRGPAGDGRLAPVARRDVVAAGVAALLDPALTGVYELTGPDAVTLDEAAELVSAVTGRDVRYQRETVEEAHASRAHYGAAPFEVEAWISTYTAIAAGEMDGVTDDVQRLTGRPPTPLVDVLRS